MYYGKSYEIYKTQKQKKIYPKEQYLTIILRILIIMILIGVIYFGYLYLSNIAENIEKQPEPAPIQTKCVAQLTPDDITKIVTIVVDKLQKNIQKEKLNDIDYSRELIKYNIKNGTTDKKDINKIDIYFQAKEKRNINSSSNGNRILIENGKDIFSIPIDDTINKDSYTQSIEQELESRKNEMKIIVVKRGDSLSKIAQKAYGDPKKYKKILQANPQMLKNPNLIYIGQKLRIP